MRKNYMKMSDIKIKKSFERTKPKEEKMARCREYWNNNHQQDRDIVINHNNYLIDGYIQYLILRENNIENAKIRISNKKRWIARKPKNKVMTYREHETTYVFGVHLNSKSTKERVWRIPNDWWKGWTDMLNIGDVLLVHTKYGLAPIEITKIKRLSECPVDISVKTVVKKLNKFKEDYT